MGDIINNKDKEKEVEGIKPPTANGCENGTNLISRPFIHAEGSLICKIFLKGYL